jgi:hypothetical protein
MDGEVQERVFEGLLLGEKSSLHLPMWLNNSTCLGPIKLTATFRAQVLSAPLQLLCGE